jgi:hypothetical protein
MVLTNEHCFYITELAEQEEEGSLVRFFEDGRLILAIPRESFKWCEVVEKP